MPVWRTLLTWKLKKMALWQAWAEQPECVTGKSLRFWLGLSPALSMFSPLLNRVINAYSGSLSHQSCASAETTFIFPTGKCVRAKLLQSCLTLCHPMNCSPPGSSERGDSPGKNTGVGCHALLLYPGIELASFMSPALAGGFFTTRATWECSRY